MNDNKEVAVSPSRPLIGCAVRDLPEPFYQDDFVTIYNADCREILSHLAPVDLTVTSPPYDSLREYQGFDFDFETTARELFNTTKQGGAVVWVVGDATINESETGTSFRQALFFKQIGFNLHDTMIFHRVSQPRQHNRYEQAFEYMFVFTHGKPKTTNIKRIVCKQSGQPQSNSSREDGKDFLEKLNYRTRPTKKDINIWQYNAGFGHYTGDKIAYEHPAIFPEKLAADHILSWSNEGDTILDPFAGSGTTLKMAKKLGRKAIGIEISKDYCQIAIERLKQQALRF